MAQRLQVHAQLVRAAGDGFEFDAGRAALPAPGFVVPSTRQRVRLGLPRAAVDDARGRFGQSATSGRSIRPQPSVGVDRLQQARTTAS